MKKKLALLLTCSMVLGLTACGGSGHEATTAATEPAAASTEASGQTEAADKAEADR